MESHFQEDPLLMIEKLKAELAREKEEKQLLAQNNELLNQENEILQAISTTDFLTGIDNLRALDKSLVREIAEARRKRGKLIVVMFDIDKFKNINDTQGHSWGDEVLKKVAQVVSATKRAEDSFARKGGEEFVLIFPEEPTSDLTGFNMDRYQAAIAQINRSKDGDGKPVTVSFGAVIVDFSNEDPKNPDPNINPERLVEEADAFMYTSKREGRNRLSKSYINAIATTHPLTPERNPSSR